MLSCLSARTWCSQCECMFLSASFCVETAREMRCTQVIYVVGVLKKRLAIPRHSPQVLRMLITACWQDDADLRPNFLTVFPLLQVQSI